MPLKGLCGRVFIRVYRLEIQSVMLVFRPSFVNYCHSNLLSVSPPRPLPHSLRQSAVQYTVYRLCVTGRGWGRVLSPVGDQIQFYRSFTLCM